MLMDNHIVDYDYDEYYYNGYYENYYLESDYLPRHDYFWQKQPSRNIFEKLFLKIKKFIIGPILSERQAGIIPIIGPIFGGIFGLVSFAGTKLGYRI